MILEVMEVVEQEEAPWEIIHNNIPEEIDTGEVNEKAKIQDIHFKVTLGENNTAIDLECKKRNGKFEKSSRVAKRLRITKSQE